jgi:hypothetical protein
LLLNRSLGDQLLSASQAVPEGCQATLSACPGQTPAG